jgi:hypothetical protein
MGWSHGFELTGPLLFHTARLATSSRAALVIQLFIDTRFLSEMLFIDTGLLGRSAWLQSLRWIMFETVFYGVRFYLVVKHFYMDSLVCLLHRPTTYNCKTRGHSFLSCVPLSYSTTVGGDTFSEDMKSLGLDIR